MYHFVMPPDGLTPRQVDAVFLPQAELLRQRGYDISLVSDDVFRDGDNMRGVTAGSTVVYRGWMVKVDEYQRLADAVRTAGGTLLTDTQSYALTHHLPNWYGTLADFTAETVVIEHPEDLVQTITQLGWGGYFLKDFVKSLKIAGGSIVQSDRKLNVGLKRWLNIGMNWKAVSAFVGSKPLFLNPNAAILF